MDLEHLHSGIHFLLVFSAVFPTSTAKMLHHPLQSVCGCIRVYIGPHKPHVLEPQSISLPYLHALICIRHPRCQHHQQLQLLSGATPPEMAQNPSEVLVGTGECRVGLGLSSNKLQNKSCPISTFHSRYLVWVS